MYPAYISKHNSNCEKQVILLMVPNEDEWYYLAVKKIIIIIKSNSVTTPRWFLLSELSSFFCNRKQIQMS